MFTVGTYRPEVYLDGAARERRKSRQVPLLPQKLCGGGRIIGAFRRDLGAVAANAKGETRISGSNTILYTAVGAGSGIGTSGSICGSSDTAST